MGGHEIFVGHVTDQWFNKMATKFTCQCLTAFLVAAAVFILLSINIAGIVTVIIVFAEVKYPNYTDVRSRRMVKLFQFVYYILTRFLSAFLFV